MKKYNSKTVFTLFFCFMIALAIYAGRTTAGPPEPTYHVMKVSVLDSEWVEFRTGFLKVNPVPKRAPKEGGEAVPIMDPNDWVEFRTGLWAQGQAIRGNEQIAQELLEAQKEKKDYVSEVKNRR